MPINWMGLKLDETEKNEKVRMQIKPVNMQEASDAIIQGLKQPELKIKITFIASSIWYNQMLYPVFLYLQVLEYCT